MAETTLDRRVAAVRRFNRFYTLKIGALEEGHSQSPFSLAEARVLYELANRARPTAGELARDLGLDAGYLSRILAGFDRRGLLVKEPSDSDGRQSHLVLTAAGRAAFAPMNAATKAGIGRMLRSIDGAGQERLVAAMQTIETLLGAPAEPKTPYLLRPHRPGDMGWVVSAHGALYAREYGWDQSFEGLVAEIAAKFIRHFDPARECCWMAEKDGETVGSAFVVRKSATVAKLRLVIVDPKARGLGIGQRLVAECIRFARQAGYRKLTLWTNSILNAARHIYEAEGFALVKSEAHRSFGHDLVGEIWELKL
ncbi:MAG: MarR family transcriptional regulator [Alphaproteobacteria bacterium]|nr:MarR family transcriptional regulator [Alphaproteobacteria bacterium]